MVLGKVFNTLILLGAINSDAEICKYVPESLICGQVIVSNLLAW